MKALIIYDDFSSALGANVALQRSARNSGVALEWDVNPWQIDMLQFPATAEEALTEALDAHLIVIAGRSVQSLPLWLYGWLEDWAKCRKIKEAALALFGVRRTDDLSASKLSECSTVASRHGLNLIFDGSRNCHSNGKASDVLTTRRRADDATAASNTIPHQAPNHLVCKVL